MSYHAYGLSLLFQNLQNDKDLPQKLLAIIKALDMNWGIYQTLNMVTIEAVYNCLKAEPSKPGLMY